MPSRQTIVGVLWKVYFWLLVTLIVAALAVEFTFLKDIPWSIFDWISYLSTPAGVIGLFGFAYRKAILGKRFWSIASPLALCGEYGTPMAYGLLAEGPIVGLQDADDAPAVVAVVALFLPHVYALLAYGYGSDGIWRNGRAEAASL